MATSRIVRYASAVLLGAVVLSGCVKAPKFYRPRKPDTLKKEARYSLDAYQKDKQKYDQLMESFTGTPDQLRQAKLLRDRMMNGILEEIDEKYNEYELALASNRAFFETGFDFLELGTSVATTISGPERVKTVLAAALTGTQGLRLSIDKNFFREKTTEIIITAMRGSRLERRNQIVNKMANLDVTEYTFEEARVDLTNLFYAGTLQGALQTLAADSGNKEAKAGEEQAGITARRVLLPEISPADLDLLTKIRSQFRAWYVAGDADSAKKALGKLGVAVTAEAASRDVFNALNAEIRKRSGDSAGLQALKQAMDIP